MRSQIVLLGGVVAFGLFVIGCGPNVIDHVAAQRFVEGDLEAAGVPIDSVECEEGVESEPGNRFDCIAIDDRGERAKVTMEVVDGEGGVRTLAIELDEAAGSNGAVD